MMHAVRFLKQKFTARLGLLGRRLTGIAQPLFPSLGRRLTARTARASTLTKAPRATRGPLLPRRSTRRRGRRFVVAFCAPPLELHPRRAVLYRVWLQQHRGEDWVRELLADEKRCGVQLGDLGHVRASGDGEDVVEGLDPSSAMNDEEELDAELGDADDAANDAAGGWTDAAVWGQGDDRAHWRPHVHAQCRVVRREKIRAIAANDKGGPWISVSHPHQSGSKRRVVSLHHACALRKGPLPMPSRAALQMLSFMGRRLSHGTPCVRLSAYFTSEALQHA